jgi:hypothetical protein
MIIFTFVHHLVKAGRHWPPLCAINTSTLYICSAMKFPKCQFVFLNPHICNAFFGDKSRYVEATREFNKILLYILKYKQYHQNSPQYDQILKKNEQMYALLAICLSLCPQNKLIDENVSTQLKEKYNDKMTKMQRYDDEAYAAYDELFSYACPKFITPSPPILDQPLTNYNQVILPHNVVHLAHQYIFVLYNAFLEFWFITRQ